MNKYRSHTCNELRKKNVGKSIVISGWINKKRDHGNLLFIDLRDNYGITQCIIDQENKNFKELEKIQLETVIKVEGKVVNRSKETINKDIETGEIEISIENFTVLGTCKELPMPVFTDQEYAEEIRLKYRYLDVRSSLNFWSLPVAVRGNCAMISIEVGHLKWAGCSRPKASSSASSVLSPSRRTTSAFGVSPHFS